jgi:hypothetical protein
MGYKIVLFSPALIIPAGPMTPACLALDMFFTSLFPPSYSLSNPAKRFFLPEPAAGINVCLDTVPFPISFAPTTTPTSLATFAIH